MKTLDTYPGIALRWEEGEYYAFATATIEGEAYQLRIPLGDGRYFAQIVTERIILPAIASRPLDPDLTEMEAAPVDFDRN